LEQIMARSDPQVNIRMPADLKEKLEAVLPETNRSLNAEIVHRLESSFLHNPEVIDRQLRLTQFEGAAERVNTLSLATLLKKISEELGPSLKAAGHPLSKIIETANHTATVTAEALNARADDDARLLKKVFEEFNADAAHIDPPKKKTRRKLHGLDE
jgi:hypothetical protein